MLFYNKGIPQIYEGPLSDKEEILEWVQNESSSEEIEDITDDMLDDIIGSMKHVAVLFYDKTQKKSQKILTELENIDDECDQQEISFVKIDDKNEALEWGIDEIPTLVSMEFNFMCYWQKIMSILFRYSTRMVYHIFMMEI